MEGARASTRDGTRSTSSSKRPRLAPPDHHEPSSASSPAPASAPGTDALWVESAEHLLREGYVTLPLLEEDERACYLEAFQHHQARFPEYLRHPDNPHLTPTGEVYATKAQPYVLGGFGGYSNPGAFHNPFARALRLRAFPTGVRLFGHLLALQEKEREGQGEGRGWSRGRKLEQLMSRMALRLKGTTTGAHHWHKDECPLRQPGDTTFGGWVNLNPDGRSQRFLCSPRSHRGEQGDRGFAAEQAPADGGRLVAVPPGHLLVFFQQITHAVLGEVAAEDSFRLYICWRLTDEGTDGPLEPDLAAVLAAQGVPRLPSNQRPPMYGMRHASAQLHTLAAPWSRRTFPAALCHDRTVKSRTSAHAGRPYRLVHQHMESLAHYGLPLYPSYMPHELALHRPATAWAGLPTRPLPPAAIRASGYTAFFYPDHTETLTLGRGGRPQDGRDGQQEH
jgi:hypothetical protein